MDSTYTKVFLKDIEVTVRIDLDPWERERPQRLVANVELFARPKDYLQTVTAESIIDYCGIYERVQSGARARAYRPRRNFCQ